MESIIAHLQLLNGYYNNIGVWMVHLWTYFGGVHCVAPTTSKILILDTYLRSPELKKCMKIAFLKHILLNGEIDWYNLKQFQTQLKSGF